jgi:FixJ family two-component response regulator
MICLSPVVRVVDDDFSFRTAMTRLLDAFGYRVWAFASAAELLAGGSIEAPGCLVVDLYMPGVNGLDLQDALRESADPLPIVFVSGRGDIPSSVRAMKAGAIDFLTKPIDGSTLREAVERALVADTLARSERRILREMRARVDELTPREREVMRHVSAGKLNKRIAVDLGTTERTIKAHRGRVMEKLGASSVATLVRIADRLGLGLELELELEHNDSRDA